MKWFQSKTLLLVVMLMPMPAQAMGSTSLESSADSLTIQAEIPRVGDFVGFGFDSLWMMSGVRLARVDASNNSVTDIQIGRASGSYRGISIGEGAVWVADCGYKLIHKVDPHANIVVKTIRPNATASREALVSVKARSGWLRQKGVIGR